MQNNFEVELNQTINIDQSISKVVKDRRKKKKKSRGNLKRIPRIHVLKLQTEITVEATELNSRPSQQANASQDRSINMMFIVYSC